MATINKIANEEFYYSSNDLTAKVPNPLYGRVNPVALSVFSDADNWHKTLPATEVDLVEMGYLNGREEPEMFVADSPQSEQVFVADKIRYKLRHEYAGVWIWYGGAYIAVVAA